MKNLILGVLALCSFNVFASDILTLQNGATFEGKIEVINNCDLQFRFEGGSYIIPASDIESAELGKMTKRSLRKLNALLGNGDNCWKGTNDGSNHGKGGGQFLCGVGFGLFGVIGCAVTSRNPMKSSNMPLMMENQDLWNNSEYINCYNKAAKSKAITNSLLGWATWVLLLL